MIATYNIEQFRDTFEHGFTWLNGFMLNARRFARKPALVDPDSGRRWTYAELNQDANRLAHALQNKGLQPGNVVMYMLFNSPEFALTYIAGHKLSAIGCPVNYRLSPGEISLQINDSKPHTFIYDAEFAETAQSALALAGHRPANIIVTSKAARAAAGSDDFDKFIANQPTSDPEPDERPHIYNETTRLYTSGTTNLAKAVPINSVNETLSAHDNIMHFPLNPTDRTMNMTPWFHRGGLHMGGPAPTFYVGGEVVILREFHPRRCLQIAADERVTFLIGAPATIALLARAQTHQPVDLSALRGLVAMGSPFDKAACEQYMRLFTPNILNGYGTTETFVNTMLRPHHLPEMVARTGQSCIDDDVRIVKLSETGAFTDPDDLVARDNKETGEIIIRAPGKSTGCYVNNPQMTGRKFHRGFHYTGDVGTWDEDEFITVLCRKDDMVIKAGENIYPAQVEGILNEHPKVAESAVIGVPDARLGQSLAAYIVPEDKSLTVQELKDYCANHPMLPGFKRPRYYKLVAGLPHTASGKIMHYKLRQQAGCDFNPQTQAQE